MKLRNKKTGEIAEIKLKLNESLPDAIRRTIEEAGWEETREPLIKDEKIRKAVRAWAEANGAWLLLVVSSYRIEISQVDAEILFNDPVFKELPRDRQLTIIELCGEEKE